jgi:outer membrane protein OmpA-like peptidoglycan-associated protein
LKKKVNACVELLRRFPKYKIVLTGHTCDLGTPESNMQLSMRRALVLKNELVIRGISESRIITKWVGDNEPVAPNDTEENRSKNRCVTLEVAD